MRIKVRLFLTAENLRMDPNARISMRPFARFLSLLLLCAAALAAPTAWACDTDSAPVANVQASQSQPGTADIADAHAIHRQSGAAGAAANCLDCHLCTSHCMSMGIVAGWSAPDAAIGDVLTETAPDTRAGIVIAPERKPPRA